MDKQPAFVIADQKKISEDTFLRAYRKKQAAINRFMEDVKSKSNEEYKDSGTEESLM